MGVINRRYRVLLIALIVFSFISLFYETDLFIDILVAILVDVIIGYRLPRKVEQNKLLQKRLNNKFNEEYFDLYWGRNIRDVQLLAKLFVLTLLILKKLKINIFGCYLKHVQEVMGESVTFFLNVISIMVLAASVAGILFASIKGKFDNIERLLFKKQQDYKPYSDSEKDETGQKLAISGLA